MKRAVLLLGLVLVACGGVTSAPTPTVPVTVSGAPVPTITFTVAQGGRPLGLADIAIKGPPDTRCGIEFTNPSGMLSHAEGLREARTNAEGVARWQWMIDADASTGKGIVTVFCGLGQGAMTMTITR